MLFEKFYASTFQNYYFITFLDDLWDLAPSITSAKTVPKFLKNWQEILRVREKMHNSTYQILN